MTTFFLLVVFVLLFVFIQQVMKPLYGTPVAISVTNANSTTLAGTSSTAAWESALIDNRTTLADDYLITLNLPMANTAPANDKTMYVWIVPFNYNAANNAWLAGADLGNTGSVNTTSSDVSITMAQPNNMKGPFPLAYGTASMTINAAIELSQFVGQFPPQGFGIVLENFTGSALQTPVITVTPVNEQYA